MHYYGQSGWLQKGLLKKLEKHKQSEKNPRLEAV
jgi:hypothetical protein